MNEFTTPQVSNRYFPSLGESVLTAICVLSIAMVSLIRYAHLSLSSRAFILIASTAFVLTAVAGGAWKNRYGRFILAEMVFCWLGDFWGHYIFLLGASFFLIGHLCFIAAFWMNGINRQRLWIAIPSVTAVSAILLIGLFSYFPDYERWFVIAYIAVLSTMVIFSYATLGTLLHRWLFAAGVLFYVSDLLLALSRYVHANVNYTYFGYPMYYGACIMFALSVSIHRWENREPSIPTIN